MTRDVPPGKLAVGMPARMRDPRPRDPEPDAARGAVPTSGAEAQAPGPPAKPAPTPKPAEPAKAVKPAREPRS